MDFLLFDFPIWISAGWMDALLLLLQLRNSLSEFGPAVIRQPSPPHYHLISYSGPLLPESLLTHENMNYYMSFCQLLQRERTFKYWQWHQAPLWGFKEELLTGRPEVINTEVMRSLQNSTPWWPSLLFHTLQSCSSRQKIIKIKWPKQAWVFVKQLWKIHRN